MSKICKICLKNDILCQACNTRLEAGKITQLDVSISRVLHNLGVEAEFVKAVNNGMVYILADKRNSRLLIGRDGKTSKKLESELKAKVRIIENSEDRGVIERVLGTNIIGINILYSPKETYRIRLQRMFKHRVKDEHVAAINNLLGKNCELIFE